MNLDVTLLRQRYAGLSLRERILVFITLLALVWGVWISSFGGRLGDEKSRQQNALEALHESVNTRSVQLNTLRSRSLNSTVAGLKAERDALREELRRLEKRVDALLEKFIPADEVPLLLEDVLSSHHGLRLVAIRTQPAQKVTVQVVDDGAAGPASLDVYRHPIQIEFSGRYADVLAYVDELEQGTWQFGWRRLEYVVAEYPQASVLLEVETLSDELEWLGV